jgi:hypothetical protein
MTMAAGGSILELEVPALADPPAAGGGCCFIALDDAVRAELLGWYGVHDVPITSARVHLHLAAERHPPTSDLVEAIKGLGIPDVRVMEQPGGGA